MSLRSAYRRLRRWHQDRRAARAQRRADDRQRRVLNDLTLLGIDHRKDERERERGWK